MPKPLQKLLDDYAAKQTAPWLTPSTADIFVELGKIERGFRVPET